MKMFPNTGFVDGGDQQYPPNADQTGGGGGGAPVDATYVVMSLNSTLTDERVLTAGVGINITDGGANGNVTISAVTPFGFDWGKAIALNQGWVLR